MRRLPVVVRKCMRELIDLSFGVASGAFGYRWDPSRTPRRREALGFFSIPLV